MLVPTTRLLQAAQAGRYAIGAFNVYNLEGAKAVAAAAKRFTVRPCCKFTPAHWFMAARL